jgi:protein-L-isoaspartate(D-aspartate) O-methyltransferase
MSAAPERLMQVLRRHVSDQRVLDAIATVPRDRFVPADLQADAWDNIPLPIGSGQTISQPLVVARMCELLELTGDETVLDVGTGSGYHAALLARLARHVYSIEMHETLSRRTRRSTSPRRPAARSRRSSPSSSRRAAGSSRRSRTASSGSSSPAGPTPASR